MVRQGGHPVSFPEWGRLQAAAPASHDRRSFGFVHEMSLAQEVCNIARRQVPEDQVERIVTVGLEVGDDAGVEPSSLVFWLELLLTTPPFKAARPAVEQVEGNVFRVTYLEVDDGRPDD